MQALGNGAPKVIDLTQKAFIVGGVGATYICDDGSSSRAAVSSYLCLNPTPDSRLSIA